MGLEITILDLKETPVSKWIPKFTNKISEFFRHRSLRKQDIRDCSFQTYDNNFSWNSFKLKLDPSELNNPNEEVPKWNDHFFDILGSGWTNWNKESSVEVDESLNAINFSNRDYSLHVIDHLTQLNPAYKMINWNIDPISNSEFEQKWFADIRPRAGTDVKVPWEMSRLQHLLPMITSSNNQEIRKEVLCQLLDFIANNPPRWGVAWSSTMEVAIRSANMALVLSMLRSDSPFEKDLDNLLLSSLMDHIRHIKENLEHNDGLGNNHYLSNLSGLLISLSAVDYPERNDDVYHFANELLKEINRQFLSDGGNFEGSTCYHGLSLEIALYGMLVLRHFEKHGLNFNAGMMKMADDRLYRAGQLLKDLTRNDSTIPQFGDNDSARFIKAHVALFSDSLNYSSTIDLYNAYFNLEKGDTFEHQFVDSLSASSDFIPISTEKLAHIKVDLPDDLKFNEFQSFKTGSESDLLKDVEWSIYPDVGLYIFKGSNIHLCINGGNCATPQYWPHGHNDQLMFDLYIEGKPIIRDPGSFTYTRDPEKRNQYRKEEAHNVPIHRIRQNWWPAGSAGVFRTVSQSKIELVELIENRITLMLTIKNITHYRTWTVYSDRIEVLDRSDVPFELGKISVPFSSGYGRTNET